MFPSLLHLILLDGFISKICNDVMVYSAYTGITYEIIQNT